MDDEEDIKGGEKLKSNEVHKGNCGRKTAVVLVMTCVLVRKS